MRNVLLALLVLGSLSARADTPLKVGVAGTGPFVFPTRPPSGFSVDVFNAVATTAHLEVEWVPVPTVDEAIVKVAKGELDAAVGPISVTAERLRSVSFTQPYFHAGLSLLVRPAPVTALERLSPLFSRALLYGLGVLLLVLAAVGTVVWLAERRANPQQFPPGPRQGIGAGMWLALVTMTTVGYGDKAPITTRGRFVTAVWMLVSMMFASSLTAGIATALTLFQMDHAELERPTELRRRRVATVAGTTSVEFARRYGAIVDARPTLEAAIARLEAGEVDAVVFDRPMLQSWLRQHPGTNALLSEAEWEPRGYAFVLPIASPRLHPLNVALAEVVESGRVAPISLQWLGQ
ncbi:MAG: transporter substrate-binding domain-containing protein [Myxococcota bacterium]